MDKGTRMMYLENEQRHISSLNLIRPHVDIMHGAEYFMGAICLHEFKHYMFYGNV